MRADARRNRDKVLAAAEELFAEGGTKANVGAIAERAGVGVGTVSRHFPTKHVLIDAVLSSRYADLQEHVERALESEDPVAAFRRFVLDTSEYQARHRALAEAMKDGAQLSEATLAQRDRFLAAISEIVRRAQDVGAIRGDIGAADVALLFAGIAQAAAMRDGIDPVVRQRYVHVLLDGLDPRSPTDLPGAPIAFDDIPLGNRRTG